jgi:hypothetical protein
MSGCAALGLTSPAERRIHLGAQCVNTTIFGVRRDVGHWGFRRSQSAATARGSPGSRGPRGRDYHPSQPNLEGPVRDYGDGGTAITRFADVVQRHATGAVDVEEIVWLAVQPDRIFPIDVERAREGARADSD